MVNIRETLKKLRLQAGMTQTELATKVGLTKSVISYYELQERSPSPEVLIKFATVFCVSTDCLLGLKPQHVQTLDISDLTDDDIKLLQYTADVLRQKNKDTCFICKSP